MLFFYWMIGIMPLDQHPFWGREIIGSFTIIKALGLICLLIAFGRMASKGSSPPFLQTPQARWYLAFFVLQCSSYFVQFGRLESGMMAYSHVFSIAALFIAALTLVNSPARFNRTLIVAIASAGFASLYTIRQQQKYGDQYGFRPGGLLGDANEYALIVGLWMPLAFMLAVSKRPVWERALCCGCLASTLLGTTFSASRGGFFGLAAAFLFLIFRSKNRVRNLIVIAALFVPLLLYSSSSVLNRFRNPSYGDQLAEKARIVTWTAGLRMVKAHPLFGIGLHNFKPQVLRYEQPGENVVSLAHNTYIELAAELGVPAVLVFVGIFIAALFSLERVRTRAEFLQSPHLGNIAVGLQAGIVSYLISAVFVSAWWQKMLWMLIACTCLLSRFSASQFRAQQRELITQNDPLTMEITTSVSNHPNA
jgi:O-antigen ligase